MWKRIQEKSRCYRILEEIIADAEDELQKPSSNLNLNLQKVRPMLKLDLRLFRFFFF